MLSEAQIECKSLALQVAVPHLPGPPVTIEKLEAVASADEIQGLTVRAGLQGLDLDEPVTCLLSPLAWALAHRDWVARIDDEDGDTVSDDSLSELRETYPELFRLSFEPP
jgi:hypothetical protein